MNDYSKDFKRVYRHLNADKKVWQLLNRYVAIQDINLTEEENNLFIQFKTIDNKILKEDLQHLDIIEIKILREIINIWKEKEYDNHN
jgi:flagella basal body P-ring formation protein FlgA